MQYNHSRKWLPRGTISVLTAMAVSILLSPLLLGSASAADEGSFNIQVSPSPLVVNLKPGEHKTATITVRNLTNHSETLYPGLKGFEVKGDNQEIKLNDKLPAGLDRWVTFKQSSITLAAGASQPLDVIYQTPSDAGFSYSVAITIKRADAKQQSSDVKLEGGVAVFNLINIDRPDAKRELTIESFGTDKSHIQFLPLNLNLSIKNTGNVIGQPSGTIFIQRSFDSTEPVATLPINQNASYVLPGNTRSFSMSWNDGFPRYVTTTDAAGKTDTDLRWDWKQVGKLRFGKYVAKVVLVYNDGHRDVPLIASFTFWVIPWKLIFGLVAVIIILIMGLVGWGRVLVNGTKKVRKKYGRK